MDREQFIEFIRHFGISRPGAYDVPLFVLAECFDSWASAGSLEPLYAYERAIHFLMDAEYPTGGMGYKLHGAEALEWVRAFLDGLTYWPPEQIMTAAEHAAVADHLALCLTRETALQSYLTSYPARRAAANAAIANRAVRQAIFSRDGYKCRKCRSRDKLTIDHIKPVRHGGTDELANLQTLCGPCNSSKGARV